MKKAYLVMKKVYAVVLLSYDDSEILGMYSSRKKAQAKLDSIKKYKTDHCIVEYEVE